MSDYLATQGSAYGRDLTGVRTITNVYIIPVAKDATTDPYDVLDNWEPADKPLGLVLTLRDAKKLNDGDWELSLKFQGVPPGEDATGITAEMDTVPSKEKITIHPNFWELHKKYGAIFDDDTGQFLGWSKTRKSPGVRLPGETAAPESSQASEIYGQDSFVGSKPVLSVTFNYSKFDARLLSDINKIAEPNNLPPHLTDMGKAPPGQNFLKRRVKVAWRGNVFQYTIEYALAIWNADIYGV